MCSPVKSHLPVSEGLRLEENARGADYGGSARPSESLQGMQWRCFLAASDSGADASCLVDGFRTRSGQNGVVTEVPQFPMVNLNENMRQNVAKYEHVTKYGNMWQKVCALKTNKCNLYGICGTCCKKRY